MRLYNPAPFIEVDIPFGVARNKRTNEIVNNVGITYDGEMGVAIAQDGILEDAGYSDKWGYWGIVKHAPDLYTFYAYGGYEVEAKIGDRVFAGTRIFETSKIGDADRPKFYFEARRERDGGQVDPFSFMNPYGMMPGVENPEQQQLVVDGILGEKTWKAWQEALKMNRTWEYHGLTDGIPGELTYTAIRNSVETLYDETSLAPEEEVLITAVQRKLFEREHYFGPETGKFDEETVSALQRALNYADYC